MAIVLRFKILLVPKFMNLGRTNQNVKHIYYNKKQTTKCEVHRTINQYTKETFTTHLANSRVHMI